MLPCFHSQYSMSHPPSLPPEKAKYGDIHAILIGFMGFLKPCTIRTTIQTKFRDSVYNLKHKLDGISEGN